MLAHILRDQLLAVVGVAIAAKVAAGVVGANVCSEIARALLAGRFLQGQFQAALQRSLKGFGGHTAAAVCAKARQISAEAGLQNHGVFTLLVRLVYL